MGSQHRGHSRQEEQPPQKPPQQPQQEQQPSSVQDSKQKIRMPPQQSLLAEDDMQHISSPPNRLRAAVDVVNQLRYRCGAIVNNENVQFFIVILISINAIMMGLATFDFVEENPDVLNAFELTDKVFLVIFTIELGMQFMFLGWRLLLDGWLVFDLIVVSISWFFEDLQIVRAFRIFRALRLVTRIEVMKNLVVALFGVMPRMGAIGILLFLVSYIFAVMFTQLFGNMYEEGQLSEDYFSRMDYTFFTLFQMMTFDSWSDITREVMAVYKWAWAPFIGYIILTAFVVVNLIIAVICDAISALNEAHDQKLEEEQQAQQEQEKKEEEEDSVTEEERQMDQAIGRTTHDIKYLEKEVDELKRAQLQTLHTLEYLAGQFQHHENLGALY